jgi:carbon storage regulator
MLVLSRKNEQKIMIGKDIVITVLKVQGDQVSIGIEAPKSMSIYREEIFREIEKENSCGAVARDSVDVKSLAKSLNLRKKENEKQRRHRVNSSSSANSKDASVSS